MMLLNVFILAFIALNQIDAFVFRPYTPKNVHNGGLSVAQSSGRVTRSFLCMSDDWSSCSVVSNEYEAEGLRLVKIQVPEELSAGYKAPGQYVKIKVGDNKPGFYAIACPPGLPNEPQHSRLPQMQTPIQRLRPNPT